jgi:hypothetical protein
MHAEPPQFPAIDYRVHPAFRGLPRGPWSDKDEGLVFAAIRDIDAAFEALRTGPLLTPQALDEAFARDIVQPARVLGESIARALPEPGLGQWVIRSIEGAFEQLRDQLRVAHRARAGSSASGAAGALAELSAKGCTAVALGSGASARLFALATPYRERLLALARQKPEHAHWVPVSPHGRLGRSLLANLASAGVDRLMAGYRGVPMAFDHLALHYSHPGQTWFKGCYRDVGVPTSPLASLHYDKDTTSMKAIVYLSEVRTSGDGAFHYLVGSHRWPRSEFQFAVRNHLDLVYQSIFRPVAAGGYYRPRFQDCEARTRMLMLPIAFHGCSHFGCDFVAEDPRVAELVAGERLFLGADQAIVFDGGRGLHRGGMVSERPRWALQLGFRPVESLPPGRLIRLVAGRTWRAIRQWNSP